MAVTGDAVHLPHLDMGHMGEKYAIRLPGIHQPGNFPAFFDILGDKFFLFLTFPLHFFMAVNALGQFRYTGIGAVFPEEMTAFTTLINQFVVKDMIELNGLFFVGIK